MKVSTENKACRICGNRNLYQFLDLGLQPLANAFLDSRSLGFEEYFPLRVAYCDNCGLVQLLDVIASTLLFKEYAYFTGKSSETMKDHFKVLAENLTKEYKLTKDDLVIDIGGNDGTLLKNFNTQTLNVEPAINVAMESRAAGIETIAKFFNAETAFDIMQEFGKAKVITATNVFAHVNNLYDFMAGVKCLLKERGVFVIEVPHWLEQFKMNAFDSCYHEHLSYFLSKPIFEIAERFGFHINRIEKIPVHGGSIRVFMETECKIYSAAYDIYPNEEMAYLYWQPTYQVFGYITQQIKESLISLLLKLKQEKKRIVGYGAPARGNVLLNYCQIGPKVLDYLVDTTPYKQGKLSPGMHIPVVSPDVFHEDRPDYALLLAWTYQDEIFIKEKEFINRGGKFIVPFPEPRIVP